MLNWAKCRLCDSTCNWSIYIEEKEINLYGKYFRISINVHASFGFVNSTRFVRKNEFLYTSLNGIVFFSRVFTTSCQADRENSCLRCESPVLTRQLPAINSADLGLVSQGTNLYCFQI